MSNKNMRNRRNKKRIQLTKRRRKIGIVVVVLIVFLFLKPTINIISGGLKTTLPSEELLVESIEGEGFFIKSEKLFKSDFKGLLNKAINEGQRVPAGTKVANISDIEEKSSLKKEIVEIEQGVKSLERFETEVEELKNEDENTEELIQEKIEEIQNEIMDNNYRYIDKETLSIYGRKQNDADSKETLLSGTIKVLEARRDIIREEIYTNNVRYYTQNAGIISYEIDGFEELYLPEDLERYTYKKLDKLDFQELMEMSNEKKISNKEIDLGDYIYKLIDDFEWYLAIKINDIKDLKNLDENQSVNIKIDNKEIEIKGFITNINKDKNEAVVILKFDTMIHKYYSKRVAMVELIKSKTNSLKIPKKSIIESEGQNGVYVKNKGGIVEFRPIFEIKEIDDYVYVKKGDNNSDVDTGEDSKTIRTITLFDEVILSPKGVKVGDIID